MSDALVFVDATPAHFAAIVRIERESGAGSLVVLTEGHALAEALERGHWLTVALDGSEVAGWIWYAIDGGRGGEEIGLVFRIAVAGARRRSGVGRALLAHAQAALAARECTRVRLTLAGDDDDTRAFLARLGYRVDALTMERAL